jgi:hypothetical protein
LLLLLSSCSIIGCRRANRTVRVAKLLLLLLFHASSCIAAAAAVAGLTVWVSHASLRSPNLKARLASAREEFRAVW